MRRLIVCTLMALAGPAAAQNFPAAAWAPLPCGATVMTDRFQDQVGAFFERDIVGDTGAAAGFLASDATFLYLRLRLDQDPAPAGVLKPFSWGFEFDLDNNTSTYELLVAVNGSTSQVAIYKNTVTTLPNDPADPADLPAVATFPFATHGRSVVAAGSMFGTDNDFFLDLAVPWSALAPLGVTPSSSVLIWAASSMTDTALNGDFACHDGVNGPPKLSALPTTRMVIDPNASVDGGVADGGPIIRAIEGGPGCDFGGTGPFSSLAVFSLLVLAVGLRQRRQ